MIILAIYEFTFIQLFSLPPLIPATLHVHFVQNFKSEIPFYISELSTPLILYDYYIFKYVRDKIYT
jgi:hypothetical protein